MQHCIQNNEEIFLRETTGQPEVICEATRPKYGQAGHLTESNERLFQ